ncbi:hypothetical protein SCHPADRAFT_795310, partial [Schizopora paradoxa]
RSAKVQKNGGIQYEMSSVESAEWLKRPEVLKYFLEKYDERASARGATFPYLVKFVPIALRTDSFDERRKVEEETGISRFAIEDMRWMKPISRREKHQKKAHLIVQFSSAKAANDAIRKEVYIRGGRFKLRALFPEPQRCHKCSQIGWHKASECKSITEVCGKCAGDHKTKLCRVVDKADMRCVNCKCRGHGSMDRDCPTFWARKKWLEDRNPAAQFKYNVFLDDPSTW